MAGNIYKWSTTPATNGSVDPDINFAEGQLPGTLNDSNRGEMAAHAGFLGDNNATLTTGGTGAAYTVTSNIAIAALATGLKLRLKMNASNTGACTLTLTPSGGSAFSAKAIRVLTISGEADPSIGMLQNNGIYDFNYDAAANSAAGAWICTNPSFSDKSGYAPVMQNGTFSLTAGSNALTIALKTKAGNDPSASDPVIVYFRNATGSAGDYTALTITAATSLVVSSGSILGTISATAFRLWICGFNAAGTFRLGVVQNLNLSASTLDSSPLLLTPVPEGIASSTAEGGAGAADLYNVIYTGTAVTSKAMRYLAYAEWNSSGVATAGNWTTTNLSLVQLVGPATKLPGDVVSFAYAVVSCNNSISSTTYSATSLQRAIVPTSAANLIRVQGAGIGVTGSSSYIQTKLSRGTTANTNLFGTFADYGTGVASGTNIGMLINQGWDFPNTTSSQTYALQAQSSAGGLVTFGSSQNCTIELMEYMT